MSTASRTIAEIARHVRDELANGDEAMARRIAFSFVETFDHAPREHRPEMVAPEPPPTGDPRYDVLLAALVEHLCARSDLGSPAWTQEQSRFLDEWWFVSGLRSLHATALVQSPISFARRGVFICDGALAYA